MAKIIEIIKAYRDRLEQLNIYAEPPVPTIVSHSDGTVSLITPFVCQRCTDIYDLVKKLADQHAVPEYLPKIFDAIRSRSVVEVITDSIDSAIEIYMWIAIVGSVYNSIHGNADVLYIPVPHKVAHEIRYEDGSISRHIKFELTPTIDPKFLAKQRELLMKMYELKIAQVRKEYEKKIEELTKKRVVPVLISKRDVAKGYVSFITDSKRAVGIWLDKFHIKKLTYDGRTLKNTDKLLEAINKDLDSFIDEHGKLLLFITEKGRVYLKAKDGTPPPHPNIDEYGSVCTGSYVVRIRNPSQKDDYIRELNTVLDLLTNSANLASHLDCYDFLYETYEYLDSVVGVADDDDECAWCIIADARDIFPPEDMTIEFVDK